MNVGMDKQIWRSRTNVSGKLFKTDSAIRQSWVELLLSIVDEEFIAKIEIGNKLKCNFWEEMKCEPNQTKMEWIRLRKENLVNEEEMWEHNDGKKSPRGKLFFQNERGM